MPLCNCVKNVKPLYGHVNCKNITLEFLREKDDFVKLGKQTLSLLGLNFFSIEK